MSTDTMDPRCRELHGDRQCQVFGNKQMVAAAYPIPSGSGNNADQALKQFIFEYGVPDSMTMDGSEAQTSRSTAFTARLRINKVMLIVANPYQPNMNPCEVVIWELRKKWYRAIFCTNCPCALWNCGLPHFAKIILLTATRAADLEGQTALGALLGETPDIS